MKELNLNKVNMKQKIIFVDTDCDFISAMTAYGYNAICCDIREYHHTDAYFVSPANSYGIDRIYSEYIFPGIEDRVMTKIQDLQIAADDEGYFYLPIGQAILVDKLIVAPTMILPGNVANTRNAYDAMTAILKVEIPKNATIICPGLCTGTGEMSAKEAALQIHEAIVKHDFFKNK
jgi:hypothetical protein